MATAAQARVPESAAAVRSEIGWQSTAFSVRAGQEFSVTPYEGTWTVDHRNFARVGAEGYGPSIDARIWQGCKVLPSQPYGRLLGRIGGGATFVVGAGGRFHATSSGRIELRINDEDRCLGDNAGTVYVSVNTGGGGNTNVDYLTGLIRTVCPDLDTDQGNQDCLRLARHLFDSADCIARLVPAQIDPTGTLLAVALSSEPCARVFAEGVRQLVALAECVRQYDLQTCLGLPSGRAGAVGRRP